ncbi:MAG: hypothetical protein WAT71_07160, partial [Ignavibacteria bacterium]
MIHLISGLPDFINSRYFLAVINQEILQSFNHGSDITLILLISGLPDFINSHYILAVINLEILQSINHGSD